MQPDRPEDGVTDGLTPEVLLHAYAAGIFPMAEGRDDAELFWVDPRVRGILPLEGFHISRSLRRRIRRGDYTIATDSDFAGVVTGCAERAETWINERLFALYLAVHRCGHAHTIEVWSERELIGGVFGVTLGGAFFGESMFSRRRDASKIALVYLVDRLRRGGFTLFDTQFMTPHLQSLGGMEIGRAEYRRRLAKAMDTPAAFDAAAAVPSPQALLQRSTQIS